ncbi:MAG: hypothetical protein JM58_03135 [Peptococcaceae bacterium BICA1-8]|nr:MAG: hypothetical protein JM58_03135 [Peptococcaceae bacterium BICA1-8]
MLDLYESLAIKIKCPPDFLDILKTIIPGDMLPILLSFNNWAEPKDIAEKLEMTVEEVKQTVIDSLGME